jgi:hypothetical protein
LFLLLLSAIGIYYLSDDQSLTIASIIHTVLGISILLFFIQHAFFYANKAKTIRQNAKFSNI